MKVQLGKLVNVKTGKLDANASSINGEYPFFTCSKEPLKISTYSYDCECVLVAGNGDLNVKYYNGKFDAYQRTYIIEDNGCKKIYIPYLYYFMDKYVEKLRTQSIGGVIKYIKLANITDVEIVLPNFDMQRKIVDKLDKVNAVINKKKRQLENLDLLVRSLFIEMFGDIINTSKYPTVNLGSLGEMLSGGTPSSEHSEYFGGNIPFISTPCLGENYISYKNAQNFLTDEGVKNSTTNLIPAYSLMIGSRVGVGKCSINMCEMCTNQDILSFINIDKTKYDLLFIKNVIEQHFDFYESQKRGATIKGISSKIVKETKVPKAPLLLQKKFANFVRGTDKSKYSSFSYLSA